MNIFLWILQILLALHTLTGAVWKFSHTAEQTMASLSAIPNALWMAMSGLEILCSIALVIPLFNKRLSKFTPIAALFIAGEMLLFCGVHLYSGATSYDPMMYWLVVAAVCAFIAYGR
jgi:hypothetical protein